MKRREWWIRFDDLGVCRGCSKIGPNTIPIDFEEFHVREVLPGDDDLDSGTKGLMLAATGTIKLLQSRVAELEATNKSQRDLLFRISADAHSKHTEDDHECWHVSANLLDEVDALADPNPEDSDE